MLVKFNGESYYETEKYQVGVSWQPHIRFIISLMTWGATMIKVIIIAPV